MTTLHLMTQRGQPYGSERRCCEVCGLMMVARPPSFWRDQKWTDQPEEWKRWPAGAFPTPDALVPCNERESAGAEVIDGPRPTLAQE